MELKNIDGERVNDKDLAIWLNLINMRGMNVGSNLFPKYIFNDIIGKTILGDEQEVKGKFNVLLPVFRCLKFVDHCRLLIIENLKLSNVKLAAHVINFANMFLHLHRILSPLYSIDSTAYEAYNTLIYGNLNYPRHSVPTA